MSSRRREARAIFLTLAVVALFHASAVQADPKTDLVDALNAFKAAADKMIASVNAGAAVVPPAKGATDGKGAPEAIGTPTPAVSSDGKPAVVPDGKPVGSEPPTPAVSSDGKPAVAPDGKPVGSEPHVVLDAAGRVVPPASSGDSPTAQPPKPDGDVKGGSPSNDGKDLSKTESPAGAENASKDSHAPATPSKESPVSPDSSSGVPAPPTGDDAKDKPSGVAHDIELPNNAVQKPRTPLKPVEPAPPPSPEVLAEFTAEQKIAREKLGAAAIAAKSGADGDDDDDASNGQATKRERIDGGESMNSATGDSKPKSEGSGDGSGGDTGSKEKDQANLDEESHGSEIADVAAALAGLEHRLGLRGNH